MSELPPPPSVLRFGAFEADVRAGELRAHGRKIKLQEKPFQLLCVLLQHPGEVVSREELREKLWPADTFVEFDDSLNHAINRLREALGDTAEKPHFVETLPRHGYRFIYPVEGAPSAQAKIPPLWVWAVGAGLAVVFLLALALNPGGLRDRLLGRPAPGEITSVAVLPLENLSGDPEQEYFADGMTETLITELSKIRALRVVSRQSVMHYKGTDKPLPEIARELNVDAVVEGSALHIGERVRITVQLIEAASDRNLWADNYDRELSDVLAMHSEVAQAIAREIKIAVTRGEEKRLARARAVNPAAYAAYLKGRFYWNRRTGKDVERAIEYFQEAIKENPKDALAYAGLADCYSAATYYAGRNPNEAFPKARVTAAKALEIDEGLGEAHARIAWVLAVYDWDWSAAEKEFKRATELNPGYATAHQLYSYFLSGMGRHDEALAHAKRAQELDPLSAVIAGHLGITSYLADQYDQAIEEYQKAINMHPNFARTHADLGQAYVQKGMYAEAIAANRKAVELSGGDAMRMAILAHANALSGRRGEALSILNELKVLSKQGYVQPLAVAMIYVGLGENDQALEWLEKGYDVRDGDMILLKVAPHWDPLRSDPRFQSLLRRLNFPE
jgi:TolB-like protein/DNA-binding winged helix-turn-helix (wHTH) protein/Flp pilus assembly protein TadD